MRSGIVFSLIALFSALIFVGCATKIAPTNVCKYKIEVSEIGAENGIDAIDFFDMAIDVAKEHRFPPPMTYDKNVGMLVFGHEDVSTMPGLKMVVYMWVPNEDLSATENICINTQQLESRETLISESMAAEKVANFTNDLEDRYKEKLENTERLMRKFNLN